VSNLDFVSAVTEPFGARLGRQESRIAALRIMRRNAAA